LSLSSVLLRTKTAAIMRAITRPAPRPQGRLGGGERLLDGDFISQPVLGGHHHRRHLVSP
jgi:hypothetical protein